MTPKYISPSDMPKYLFQNEIPFNCIASGPFCSKPDLFLFPFACVQIITGTTINFPYTVAPGNTRCLLIKLLTVPQIFLSHWYSLCLKLCYIIIIIVILTMISMEYWNFIYVDRTLTHCGRVMHICLREVYVLFLTTQRESNVKCWYFICSWPI